MKNKLIPERLTGIREARGLSIPEAAKQTGIDKTAFWRYEQGAVGPSDTALRILALYLHTSEDYLTGRTDDPEPHAIVVNVSGQQELEKLLTAYKKLSIPQQEIILALMYMFIYGERSSEMLQKKKN